MHEIIYDIHSKRPLILGYVGENNAAKVTFKGFKKQSDTSTMYLVVDGWGDENAIPLVDGEAVMQYAYMKNEGSFGAILAEYTTDKTLIHKENIFPVIVKHSVEITGIIPEETPEMELWYTKYGELYEKTGLLYTEIKTAYESGEFKGEKGDKGDTGARGEKGADGHTPTKGTDYWTAADKTEIVTEVKEDIQPEINEVSEQVTAETTARTTADETLQSNIDAEATARQNADTELLKFINSETSARTAADTTLQANIDNEATARAEADEIIEAKIDDTNSKKVGYQEVVGNVLYMYSDDTKAILLATLELPAAPVQDVQINGSSIISDGGGS